jgi:hypothetical protein
MVRTGADQMELADFCSLHATPYPLSACPIASRRGVKAWKDWSKGNGYGIYELCSTRDVGRRNRKEDHGCWMEKWWWIRAVLFSLFASHITMSILLICRKERIKNSLWRNEPMGQELPGHSTISMTLDTYSHVLPSMLEEALTGLNTMLQA